MENPRSRALRSRRSSLIVLAVVATLIISGGAAYALGSGSASLTDPEAILDIARSEGLDVDEASITTRPLEAAQAVSGLTMTLVEYESSDGLCRDIVLSLGGQSGSVGYCAPAESSLASSLAEAVLSTGGLALDGTYLYIVDGHVAPDAFPPGTSIETDLFDGTVATAPVLDDGRFYVVLELDPAPRADQDAVPSTWRAVSQDGAILETRIVVQPDGDQGPHDAGPGTEPDQ